MISYVTRIYYDDTDAGGVMYYANYLKLCERAKQEFFLKNNCDLFKLHDEGILLVVSKVEAHYIKPIYLGETVVVDVKISKMKAVSAILDFRLLVDNEERSSVQILSACVKDGKPLRLPDCIQSLWKI